jgi:hypothetical protein
MQARPVSYSSMKMSRVWICAWLIRRVLVLVIEFIDTFYKQLRTTGSYSSNADLDTLQITVTHELELSVFTSRILATDLKSLTVTSNHTRSLLFTAQFFLAIILQMPTQFNSSAPEFISCQAGVSTLDSILLKRNLLYNHFRRTKQKTQSLYFGKACLQLRCITQKLIDFCLRICCRGNVFTESFSSNERLVWHHYSNFLASCHNI